MTMSVDAVVQIDKELCTGCRCCAEICPTQAIEGEFGKPQTINSEACISCGRCVQECSGYDSIFDENIMVRSERLKERKLFSSLKEPLFAAYDRYFIPAVKKAINTSGLLVMAYCDSTVCNSIAEDFGLQSGALPPGKVAAALRKTGFDSVYNTNLAAGFAILEEAYEFVERLDSGRILPVINSSCPASVKYIEQFYPELIHYLSSCKSPHQIAGALAKTFGASQKGVDPENIYSVSIMPCTSRKFEANRPEMKANGYWGHRDIDAVLTTRELAYLIKDAGIDIVAIAEEPFDTDQGDLPGLENVYCTTGDVTQAVLHTCYELANDSADSKLEIQFTGEASDEVRFTDVRLGDYPVKAVAISGLHNAVPFLEAIRAGKSDYGFMEIMACPKGCVSGGGQPKVLLPKDKMARYSNRASYFSVCGVNPCNNISRQSAIKQIYELFFAKPYGDKSNRVLHTQYLERRLKR
jgi:iron only hydrogenase large subunit-like protein